jgi:hypothetical protein
VTPIHVLTFKLKDMSKLKCANSKKFKRSEHFVRFANRELLYCYYEIGRMTLLETGNYQEFGREKIPLCEFFCNGHFNVRSLLTPDSTLSKRQSINDFGKF